MKIKIVNKKKRKTLEDDNINNMFFEKEREVAKLLLGLSNAIFHLESPLLSLLPFNWGSKRVRSAIQDTPSKTTTCVPVPPLYQGGAAVAPPYEVASSPATPLSLSLIDSDDKAEKTLLCNASIKRKKEYYVGSIEDLTKSKASLNKEIENVKRHSEHLSAFNLMLKSRKQELSDRSTKAKLENGWPIKSSNSMAENHQFHFQVSNSTQYVSLMLNQTCGPSQICNTNKTIAQSYSSTALAPIGILDLNVSSEEIIHMESRKPLDVNGINKDLKRATAAQARHRRIQINKLKNNIVNTKTR